MSTGVIIDSAVYMNDGPIYWISIIKTDTHVNPIDCPSMVFISKYDPMVNYDDHIKTFEKHRNNGLIAMIKSWDQSPHVAHYVKYPDEYRSTLIKFLDQIMSNDDDDDVLIN